MRLRRTHLLFLIPLLILVGCVAIPPTMQLEDSAKPASDGAAGRAVVQATATMAPAPWQATQPPASPIAAATAVTRTAPAAPLTPPAAPLTPAAAKPSTPITTTAAQAAAATVMRPTAQSTLAPTLAVTRTAAATAAVAATPVVAAKPVTTTAAVATAPITVTAKLTATIGITPTVAIAPIARITVTAPITAVAPITATVAAAKPAITSTATVTTAVSAAAPAAPVTKTMTVTPTAAITSTALAAAPPITAGRAITAEINAAGVNLRGGPGTDFAILSVASSGQKLAVTGRSADSRWWRVCCVAGGPAWVSADFVDVQGVGADAPVAGPSVLNDFRARWSVRWTCSGDGCPSTSCEGEFGAQAVSSSPRWLEVKRSAAWKTSCGVDEDWLVQIDRYTGQERQTPTNWTLFDLWAGPHLGPENLTVTAAGQTLSLWCAPNRVREVEQARGWTVEFDAQACYDRSSGLLVTLDYTKRWLFTGTHRGRTYERGYFGDQEVVHQKLVDTNVSLRGK